jgi:coenzyme F420 hydrogenase subunit beta
MYRKPNSVSEVVKTGLCIGCGLCEAMTNGRVNMQMTDQGSLRPSSLDDYPADESAAILAVCPGATVEAKKREGAAFDNIWGSYSKMQYGWATNSELRFKASTGGALTALGAALLRTGKVEFILHVCADAAHPMRSTWVISKTPEEVIERSGSRYGPTAPLAGFVKALDKGQRFAIIAKPCDISAVHNYSKIDPRVNSLCIARLALICGGQSKLSKSKQLLSQFGVNEENLSSFRYRGHGNPGLTQVETKDSNVFEITYNELWKDEHSWDLETRCKFCPDALGETADVTASDVWLGGGPTGEDAGFNGIITRSRIGDEIVEEAEAGGDLTLGETISIEQYNKFQPHQLRRKQALQARFDARASAHLPVTQHTGLRVSTLSYDINGSDYRKQFDGTKKRITDGRMAE